MLSMDAALKPRRLQPLGVDAVRLGRGAAAGHHVGRHVAQHDRAAGDEGVHAHAAELVHHSAAAENDVIMDGDVAGERARMLARTVWLPTCAVVRQVHIGHDPVVVAHARDAHVLRGAGVEGAELADRVVIADLEPGRLAAVLLVLRHLAQRHELERRGWPGRCGCDR